MTPQQREAVLRLVDALQSGADDPMWAHHAEIKKSTLGYAAALLRELAAEPVQAPDLVRDFPAVKAAKKAAEAELGYYREMMAAEPVQAPVAWMSTYPGLPLFVTHAAHEHPQSTAVRESYTVPLYAAPQQLMRCPEDGGECGAGGYCRPEPAVEPGFEYKRGYEEALNDCIRNGMAWARSMFANNAEHIKPAEPQGDPVGLDAVRQAIEERDDMERKYHDLAEHMVYHGNSVSWWHSKARAYRDAVDKVWSELKAAGIVCDGIKTSADGVRELANPPQQRKPPREQITAAAKALCRQASIACNVDFDDNWKVYGDEYIADATAALNAAYGIGEPT